MLTFIKNRVLDCEESVLDKGNNQNLVVVSFNFNSSICNQIKLLPSQASGLNVISETCHIRLPTHQQYQHHSLTLSNFGFSPMHQPQPAIFPSFLQILEPEIQKYQCNSNDYPTSDHCVGKKACKQGHCKKLSLQNLYFEKYNESPRSFFTPIFFHEGECDNI